MKETVGDQIKAMMTRDMLTCHCGHPQLDHLHQLRDGWGVIGKWKECLTQGCRCQQFRSLLSGIDKRELDKLIDRKVEAKKLATVMKDQPLPLINSTFQGEAAKAPKGKRSKERTRSANRAGVSPLYHEIPTRKPGELYQWQEIPVKEAKE